MILRHCIFCGLLIAGLQTTAISPAAAQPSLEVGKPFFNCFRMKEYGGGSQNWDMLQDDRGVVYVGNNFGVLEYDGASWRMIRTPNRNVLRSLSQDVGGRIYLGAFSELGYLEEDAAGSLEIVTLQELLSGSDRQFSDVWTTYATPEGIYFQSRERLFRFTPLTPDAGPSPSEWTITTWEPQDRFMYAFWNDGSLYVHESGRGVLRLVDDKLVLIPGSEIFADDRMQVMLSMSDGRYLFGAFTLGLFVWDGDGFESLGGPIEERLKEAVIYKGAVLADGSFALGTLQDGLYVIDETGSPLMHMSDEEGLSSATITAIEVDRRGTLWLSPENGLCQIETPSPLSRFGAAEGIGGNISDIVRHDGRLYAVTTMGIYYFDNRAREFKAVAGMASGNPQAWFLLPMGPALLAASATGVYEVQGTHLASIRESVAGSFESQVLHQSKQDPNRVFVGLSDGLAALYRNTDGSWTDEGVVPGVTDYTTQIVELKPGEIWLGVVTAGTARLQFAQPSSIPTRIDRYGREHGLGSDGGTSVFIADGNVIHAQNEGVFRFDDHTGRFEPDPLLGHVVSVGGSQEEFSVAEDHQGNIWTNFGGETAVLRRKSDGSFETDKTALLRFADSPSIDIYPEDDGIVWFGGNEVLIRYDQGISKDYGSAFPALVRRVTVGEDSVVYGGGKAATSKPHVFASGHDAIRFEYASPSFENPSENRFQSILEGFDEKWSSWTSDVRRDYTNLPGGQYVFRVRARNTYAQESEEAAFAFTVTAPWFATWWAYLLYILGAGLAVFGFIRVRTGQLQRRSKELEVLIDQRTAELRDKATELSKQKAEVEQAYENVELLSRLGQDITATLSIKGILDRVYENVNSLMDASVFGIGIYNAVQNRIEMPATKEKGETLPPFWYSLDDDGRPAVWAFKNRGEIYFNDYEKDYAELFGKELVAPVEGENPKSMIYLPLVHKDKAIGVITAQSFRSHAYTEYHLNIVRNLAIYAAIAIDNAEAYERLNATLAELNSTVQNLKTTQQQLVTQEKLASLGSLTAGIAHEIKNPLNFVNNFAELVSEMARELDEEITANKDRKIAEVFGELDEILTGLKINAAQIRKHGRRADGIVKSMMDHAREGEGERYSVGVNDLVDEYVALAEHGARARTPELRVKVVRNYDDDVGNVVMSPQEMGRVILNLLGNAFDAVGERAENEGSGSGYQPEITVSTRRSGGNVEFVFADNGGGIPDKVKARIFEPFFTTKPTGGGTGLGLSLSYDIVVQGHGGTITVDSKDGKGSTFTVILPLSPKERS